MATKRATPADDGAAKRPCRWLTCCGCHRNWRNRATRQSIDQSKQTYMRVHLSLRVIHTPVCGTDGAGHGGAQQ